ncbi:MAG: gamma-glutamyl-gamma-aminobutyrate hydrolase family protein [Candidatus Thermoplasmatota archaeon]
MILVLNICKEVLHSLEFVKPIEDIIKRNGSNYVTHKYDEIEEKKIIKFDKVIICGTSLYDSFYLKNIERFKWIKSFKKPILGICAGMQILLLINGGTLHKNKEIGLKRIYFKKEFLGLNREVEVYELHKYYVSSKKVNVYAESSFCPQAIKFRDYPYYGVLFHPEVRNKILINEFISQ